jgi:hypothetical protein
LSTYTWNGLKTISHSGGLAGVTTDFYRFPSRKVSIFVTGNIGDSEIYRKGLQMASIWFGLQQDDKFTPFTPDFTKMNSNFVSKDSNQPIKNPEKYVGYYLQEELETVQEIYSKENQIFLSLKNFGEIPLTFIQNNYFKIGEIAIGRFLFDGDRVTGMVFINIPRAPMVMWRKLPSKPICLN